MEDAIDTAFGAFDTPRQGRRVARQTDGPEETPDGGGPPAFVRPVVDWAKNNPGKTAVGGVAAWWLFLQ